MQECLALVRRLHSEGASTSNPRRTQACPPAWDLSPLGYRRLTQRSTEPLPPLVAPFMRPVLAGGGVAAALLLFAADDGFVEAAPQAADIAGNYGILLGAAMATLGLGRSIVSFLTEPVVDTHRVAKAARTEVRQTLAGPDRAKLRTFTYGGAFAEWDRFLGLLDGPDLTAQQRREVLTVLYALADNSPAGSRGGRAVPGRQPARAVRAPAPTPSPTPAPAPALSPEPTATTSSPESVWTETALTHDRVIDQWSEIITDPLQALTHAALFDVTQPRTAAFIEAYGAAADFRALHGTTWPGPEHGPQHLADYLPLVRRAHTTWEEARRYTERTGWSWLPETEATAARRAAGLLAVAADENATFHERAAAAKKAASLLESVTSFLLPAATLAAIDTAARPAIA